MHRKRLRLACGGLLLSMGLLAACSGPTATATLAPTVTAVLSTPGTASPTVAVRTTAIATPGPPTNGTPTGGFTPAQGYVRLQTQPSHRQRWSFTGFTVAGLSGNLTPVYDVVGNNRKVTLPNVAGVSLVAYQIAGAIAVANSINGGFTTAEPNNPLSVPAQALFALPDTVILTLAPANGIYTMQGTQSVNGRTVLVYRTQLTLADLGFVSPTLQGQAGTATTTVYLDSIQGYFVVLESTVKSSSTATTAIARLDVTDIGQVPAITVPR